jgi:hypothetical protein
MFVYVSSSFSFYFISSRFVVFPPHALEALGMEGRLLSVCVLCVNNGAQPCVNSLL